MFGSFGFDEILMVTVVAIIVFGRDLPRVARQVGRYYGKLKRQFMDVRDEINSALDAEEARRNVPEPVKPPEERQINRDDIEDPPEGTNAPEPVKPPEEHPFNRDDIEEPAESKPPAEGSRQ